MRIKLFKIKSCDNCGKLNPKCVNTLNSNNTPSRITACCLEDKGFYGPYDAKTLELISDLPKDNTYIPKYSNGKIWTDIVYFQIKFNLNEISIGFKRGR